MPKAKRTKPAGLRTYRDDFERVSQNAKRGGEQTVDKNSKSEIRNSKHASANIAPKEQPPQDTSTSTTDKNPNDESTTVSTEPKQPEPTTQPNAAPAINIPSAQTKPAAATSPEQKSAPATPAPKKQQTDAFVGRDLEKIRKNARSKDVTLGDHSVGEPTSPSIEGGLGEGTIVTDQKRDRFRLIPAVIDAFKGWLFEQKETYEARQKPKHTVAPAEDRREVVEQAAQQSSFAPKDDYQNVSKRLRHVPRTKQTDEVTVRDAAEIPDPSWTHTDNENPKSEIRNPNDESTATSGEPTEPATEEQDQTQNAQLAADVQQESEQQTELTEKEPETENRSESPNVPNDEPTTTDEPIEPTETQKDKSKENSNEEPVDRSTEPEQPETAPQSTRPEQVQQSQQPSVIARLIAQLRPTLPYLLIGGAALVAAGLGFALVFWLIGGTDSTPADDRAAPTLPTHVAADTEITLPIGVSHRALMENLAAASQDAPEMSVAELHPMIETESGSRPATTEEIRARLSLSAPGGFVRTISDIGFGVYRRSEPFIILNVHSFDAALGGILEWEADMSDDLAPFFGQPVTQTVPLSATSTARDPFFVDDVHQNRDIRVLRDGAQTERIVYSFLDRHTILITTDRTVIADVAPLVE